MLLSQIVGQRAAMTRYHRTFADFPTEPGAHQPEFVAHMESCSLVKGGIPAGSVADPVHRHPFDQFYYVLSGTVGVQFGVDRIAAGPDTLVRIPAGQPHFAYNEGQDDVLQLEILLPTPVPATNGQMVPVRDLCDDSGASVPPNCVTSPRDDGWRGLGDSGPQFQILANRASGSEHGMVSLTRMPSQPDPGPTYRVHSFDELWFVLDGALTVDLAGETILAQQHDLVIVPGGVPYRAWNADAAPERHLTVVTPEPDGVPLPQWSRPVSFAAS